METVENNKKQRKSHIIKNVLIGLLFVAAVGAGYMAYELHQENEMLTAEYQSEREATNAYMVQTFHNIESNLAEIRKREMLIRENLDNPENVEGMSAEERIDREIQMIEGLIEKNHEMIAELNENVDGKNAQLSKYEKSVNDLNARILQYKNDLLALQATRDSLMNNLAEVQSVNEEIQGKLYEKEQRVLQNEEMISNQEQELSQRDLEMNKVYFVVGSFKELRDENIVKKEGGILGIGAVKKLSEQVNPGKFNSMDKRDVKGITLNARKAEVITNHDPASYELVMDNEGVEMIKITDPAKFWEKSKYLVILTKDAGDPGLAEAMNR
ncbi:MAG: hypothetical protein ACLFPE_13840 [Bacteroidales bacterium]